MPKTPPKKPAAKKKKKNKKLGAPSTALALQTVKGNGGGIVRLMSHLIGGKGYELPNGTVFTLDDLSGEWRQGGKEVMEGTWRQSANTRTGHSVPKEDFDPENPEDNDEQYEEELGSGQHEWIPTNMLSYVIEMATKHNDEAQALQWLMLTETLRIPTRFVMLKPVKEKAPLSGHVGALYSLTKGKYKQLTKGQGPFHDKLRTILKNNLSAERSNVAGYRQELLAYIREAFWHGESLAVVKDDGECPYFYNSGVGAFSSWGKNMAEMRHTLALGWTTHFKILENTFAAVMPITNTNIPFSHSSLALQKGEVFPGDEGMNGEEDMEDEK
jgi:hypothetical protein